ncbi:GNAT family N-acetyltransferase [Haloarcula onubensis]|uniref:GNAT family N-acetyltransferase n=1 Tax=Haloarcula onubensis TaxID=2950539 RepID=A0ABU2FUU0_9EURY|nr:GNAT family N-acetyltransferase [Halomicroarcula sp. S3CR25-11]MDS0284533.1 GNAT family N-acetyltransferase [Halomicroarcula sp. S3CR25-11]
MDELETAVHHSITAVKRGEWNAVVAQQSDTGSVFERYEWLAAYEAATDARARHVTVRKSGTLVGVHPSFVRPLPGTPFRFLGPPKPGTNGAMIATDEAAVFDAIADEMASLSSGRTIGHLFRPASERSLRYATRLREREYYPTVRDCRFVLDIDRPWADVHADLSQKKRRNLRKADDGGVTATDVPVTPDTVEAFGRRHAEHVARLDGDGASPAFLRALLTHVGDRLKLFRATVDGAPAGELLAVLDDERDALVLLFPAYDPANFTHFPSEVLYRAAIRWGIDAGYATCDFGETTPDFADGTFSFKSDFGGQARPGLRWERVDSVLGRVLYLLGSDRVVARLFGGRRRR